MVHPRRVDIGIRRKSDTLSSVSHSNLLLKVGATELEEERVSERERYIQSNGRMVSKSRRTEPTVRYTVGKLCLLTRSHMSYEYV